MAETVPAVRAQIHVLILEDRPEDALLMIRELRNNGFDPAWERAETEDNYLHALQSLPDVILADYRMPQLDAPRALELLNAQGWDIPFIVVSGAIGEEEAVEMMRNGAADYVLKDRLKRLGAAVRRAVEERSLREQSRKAEHALHASEERFYSFMNNSPALAFIKDTNGRILYINNRCQQIWNRTLQECQGKLDSDLWPGEVASRMRANDLAVLQSGETSRVTEEVPLKDGSVHHMLSFRFPFTDAAGCRMLGGFSVDITEQMKTERSLHTALAAKEVLLKEVHHRVKNNLQIISSLLNIQADQLADPQLATVFRESQQRVHTMAMIHERLYGQEDVESLDFREYVEELARNLMGAYGVNPSRIHLVLKLSEVSLELNQAIPCSLILNELLTNSIKYAFPNGSAGTITVGLELNEGNVVTLRVVDNGVGLRLPLNGGESQSLGLKIVRILARQLRATLEQGDAPGTSISLSFERSGAPKPVAA